AVQILNVLSDYIAFEVLPRTVADTITRIYGRFAIDGLCTEIGAPYLGSRTMPFSQLLAMFIGALAATEVSAFAWTKPGEEKRHARRLGRRLLCLRTRCHTKCNHNKNKWFQFTHRYPSVEVCYH